MLFLFKLIGFLNICFFLKKKKKKFGTKVFKTRIANAASLCIQFCEHLKQNPSIVVQSRGIGVVFFYSPNGGAHSCSLRLLQNLNEQLLLDLSSAVVSPLGVTLLRRSSSQRTLLWFRPSHLVDMPAINEAAIQNFCKLLGLTTSLIDATLHYSHVFTLAIDEHRELVCIQVDSFVGLGV